MVQIVRLLYKHPQILHILSNVKTATPVPIIGPLHGLDITYENI